MIKSIRINFDIDKKYQFNNTSVIRACLGYLFNKKIYFTNNIGSEIVKKYQYVNLNSNKISDLKLA